MLICQAAPASLADVGRLAGRPSSGCRASRAGPNCCWHPPAVGSAAVGTPGRKPPASALRRRRPTPARCLRAALEQVPTRPPGGTATWRRCGSTTTTTSTTAEVRYMQYRNVLQTLAKRREPGCAAQMRACWRSLPARSAPLPMLRPPPPTMACRLAHPPASGDDRRAREWPLRWPLLGWQAAPLSRARRGRAPGAGSRRPRPLACFAPPRVQCVRDQFTGKNRVYNWDGWNSPDRYKPWVSSAEEAQPGQTGPAGEPTTSQARAGPARAARISAPLLADSPMLLVIHSALRVPHFIGRRCGWGCTSARSGTR